ncbi:MAG: hypothetical protein JKY37_20600 [Nannocystaceae bacterium]|nr:hypothetical protein [Nannocystaceae bacterium]
MPAGDRSLRALIRRGALVGVVVVVALAASACSGRKGSAQKTQPPPQTAGPVDSLRAAQRELDANDRRLADLGIIPGNTLGLISGDAVSGDAVSGEAEGPAPDTRRVTAEGGDQPPTPAVPADPGTQERAYVSPEPAAMDSLSSASEPESRCARICALSEFSCALAQQVCELAAGHPDERRYGEVCERAQAQCEAASSACDACQ